MCCPQLPSCPKERIAEISVYVKKLFLVFLLLWFLKLGPHSWISLPLCQALNRSWGPGWAQGHSECTQTAVLRTSEIRWKSCIEGFLNVHSTPGPPTGSSGTLTISCPDQINNQTCLYRDVAKRWTIGFSQQIHGQKVFHKEEIGQIFCMMILSGRVRDKLLRPQNNHSPLAYEHICSGMQGSSQVWF